MCAGKVRHVGLDPGSIARERARAWCRWSVYLFMRYVWCRAASGEGRGRVGGEKSLAFRDLGFAHPWGFSYTSSHHIITTRRRPLIDSNNGQPAGCATLDTDRLRGGYYRDGCAVWRRPEDQPGTRSGNLLPTHTHLASHILRERLPCNSYSTDY